MFDFLFQDRNKEIQSLAEIIAVDMEKLNLSKLAIEKAIMMIAKAIAKSDILIQTESKEKNKKEYIYWWKQLWWFNGFICSLCLFQCIFKGHCDFSICIRKYGCDSERYPSKSYSKEHFYLSILGFK